MTGSLPEPYYQDDHATIYHGGCLELLSQGVVDPLEDAVLLNDPPYGMSYRSGARRLVGNARSIQGDEDTAVRDWILGWWHDRGPALIFGKRTIPAPDGVKMYLTWDKGPALGMGDLSLPWKPSTEEIYVIGSGFVGKRDMGSVYSISPVQSVGRLHPHEKPVELLKHLLTKCPDGLVVDPTMGIGSTLRAAKDLGRKSIGIEWEEKYCEIAAKRLAQEVLEFA